MEEKQLAKNSEHQLPVGATAQQLMDEYGVGSTDIMLPRILLMQGTSEFVGEEKAKLGDLVNSQTVEVLGGFNKPIEIIPLKKLESIFVYDSTKQPAKFLERLEATPANKGLPYEDVKDGIMIKRFLAYTFRILLRSDIKEGKAYPYEFTVKSSSLSAGKQLASMMFQSMAMGQVPYSQSYVLSVSKEQNEAYYAVARIAKGSALSLEELAVAKHWKDQLSVKNVVSAEEDVPF